MFAIPIKISASFLVLIGILAFLLSFSWIHVLVWTVILIVSLLVHEFGHALTARYFGQTAEILLHGWGGTTIRKGPKLKLWQEFFIVLNGPLFEFFFLVGNYFLLKYVNATSQNPLLVYALNVSIMINTVWIIFNLLPIMPLDGGHLVKISLFSFFGYKGYKALIIFSLVVSPILGVIAFGVGQVFIGIVFFIIAYENYATWTEVAYMGESDQKEENWEKIKKATTFFEAGNYSEAWNELIELKKVIHDGRINVLTIQMMASILLMQMRSEEAYQLILPILNKITPDFTKHALQIAYNAGEYEKSIELGKRAYQLFPDGDVAIVNALSHAGKKESQPTLGWLKLAYEKQFPELKMLLQRREFDFIRDNQDFQKIWSAVIGSIKNVS